MIGLLLDINVYWSHVMNIMASKKPPRQV